MIVTLDEMKQYLRVDYDEDDGLILDILGSAERLCADAARMALGSLAAKPEGRTAVMYAAAYLYEHREEADHHALALTLRALLSGIRKERF